MDDANGDPVVIGGLYKAPNYGNGKNTFEVLHRYESDILDEHYEVGSVISGRQVIILARWLTPLLEPEDSEPTTITRPGGMKPTADNRKRAEK